ncbi:MAG: GntR family transcriptional regulator [Armatimonadota bacterium]
MSTSPSPLQLQRSGFSGIADQLRRSVREGRLRVGQQLPAISELAREYRTTAITVRRALRSLEEEGLLRVEHGVGTFVTAWHEQFELQLPSFSSQMAEQALATATEVCERRTEVRHPRAAEALGLEAKALLAAVVRLRSAEGRPMAVQTSYLPGELAAVVQGMTPDASLYVRLREATGRIPVSAEERLTVAALPPEAAGRLQRPAGGGAWLSERVTLDAAGRPLVYDEAYLPADAVSLRVRRRGREAAIEFEVRPAEPQAGK